MSSGLARLRQKQSRGGLDKQLSLKEALEEQSRKDVEYKDNITKEQVENRELFYKGVLGVLPPEYKHIDGGCGD